MKKIIIVISLVYFGLSITSCDSSKKTVQQNQQIPSTTGQPMPATENDVTSGATPRGNNNQPNGTPPSVDEIFVKMDANKDGKLSKEEVKGPLKNDFDKIDLNKDSFISKEELSKAPKPNRQGGGQQGPPPNGGN
jgi:EF hand